MAGNDISEHLGATSAGTNTRSAGFTVDYRLRQKANTFVTSTKKSVSRGLATHKMEQQSLVATSLPDCVNLSPTCSACSQKLSQSLLLSGAPSLQSCLYGLGIAKASTNRVLGQVEGFKEDSQVLLPRQAASVHTSSGPTLR